MVMTGIDRRFDRRELARALDGLYDAFAGYPLKERIDLCPHCQLDAAERRLHLRPLREMTWDDLGVFSFRAMTTFGDEDDFKHFLPRLLELYVLDHRGAPHTLFMVFGKLADATWEGWPAEEVAAIRHVVEAWQRVLAARAHESEDDAWELDEVRAAVSAW
jgi:hypothetical protein